MNETILNIEVGEAMRPVAIRKIEGEWFIKVKDLSILGEWNPLISIFYLVRAMREAMKK